MRHKKPKAARAAAARAKNAHMPPDRPHILDLPWDIRRLIIAQVLKQGRRKAPTLTPEFLENRVPLRNCFDPDQSTHTNIYISRNKPKRLHGNGLMATNRQLRQDTLDVIRELYETVSSADYPFVLDVILVKDVGLFPTWMSFPFKPRRLDKLRIDLRIFRADPNSLPGDWIDAAQYPYTDEDRLAEDRSGWCLRVLLFYYAMGRLSLSPSMKQVQKENNKAHWKVSQKDKMPGFAIRHFDARLSTMPPSAVDEISLGIHPLEYYADGRTILPYVDDYATWRDSELLVPLHIPFARGFFCLCLLDDGDGSIDELVESGKWGAFCLTERLLDCMNNFLSFNSDELTAFHDTLIGSVGHVRLSDYDGNCDHIVGPGDSSQSWTAGFLAICGHVRSPLAALAEEEAKIAPSEKRLNLLRQIKRRMELGW